MGCRVDGCLAFCRDAGHRMAPWATCTFPAILLKEGSDPQGKGGANGKANGISGSGRQTG